MNHRWTQKAKYLADLCFVEWDFGSRPFQDVPVECEDSLLHLSVGSLEQRTNNAFQNLEPRVPIFFLKKDVPKHAFH
jgi:hypothetical protein